MKQTLEFEFNLRQSGDGLRCSSPEIKNLYVYLEGKEDKKSVINTLLPTLEYYLATYYDLEIERSLIELQGLKSPMKAGQKLNCIVSLK